MVAVIGDSMARAFGLVGLGAFIRFRSGIKDPRDAAVMFVMIGIGMACGLGAVPIAVVATLFVTVVLAMFDAGQRARRASCGWLCRSRMPATPGDGSSRPSLAPACSSFPTPVRAQGGW